jgi:hypothetical protein
MAVALYKQPGTTTNGGWDENAKTQRTQRTRKEDDDLERYKKNQAAISCTLDLLAL